MRGFVLALPSLSVAKRLGKTGPGRAEGANGWPSRSCLAFWRTESKPRVRSKRLAISQLLGVQTGRVWAARQGHKAGHLSASWRLGTMSPGRAAPANGWRSLSCLASRTSSGSAAGAKGCHLSAVCCPDTPRQGRAAGAKVRLSISCLTSRPGELKPRSRGNRLAISLPPGVPTRRVRAARPGQKAGYPSSACRSDGPCPGRAAGANSWPNLIFLAPRNDEPGPNRSGIRLTVFQLLDISAKRVRAAQQVQKAGHLSAACCPGKSSPDGFSTGAFSMFFRASSWACIGWGGP